MSIKTWFWVAVAGATFMSSARPSPPARISQQVAPVVVDLTHTLDKDFPFIPVPGITFGFSLEPIATLEKNGVAANAWHIHEHLGTQIDAPSHFSRGGQSMEALAAQLLIVPIVVIDFRRESSLDPDAVVQPHHIQAWERSHGRIPDGAVVALYTGWDRKLDEPAYLGLDDKSVKHFPGFGPDAVGFLLAERHVWGVAVDTISFDVGVDGTYGAHRALLGAGKWALEALANLERLPAVGATVFIGAPKVRGATGGIARVIALVPEVSVSRPELDGAWESSAIEKIPGPRPTYLQRMFRFEQDRWSVDFTLFADAKGHSPVLRGQNKGRFTLGQAMPLANGTEADFTFETRSLTPLTDSIADALTAAKCGNEPWHVGQSQDVMTKGCLPFRVPVAEACPTEFDIVRLEAGRLFFGPRSTAADSLCAAKRRPAFADGAELTRDR